MGQRKNGHIQISAGFVPTAIDTYDAKPSRHAAQGTSFCCRGLRTKRRQEDVVNPSHSEIDFGWQQLDADGSCLRLAGDKQDQRLKDVVHPAKAVSACKAENASKSRKNIAC